MAAKKQTQPTSRLKNLDALYELNGGINPLEQQAPPVSERQDCQRAPSTVEIEKLKPFRRHPFKLIGQKPKPNRTPIVKINKAIYARYFKPDQPAKEIEEIVEKALVLYFNG